MNKETRAEKIKRLCAEKNVSVADVLRKAGASAVTINNWEEKEPKSFQIYDSIMKVIEDIPATITA